MILIKLEEIIVFCVIDVMVYYHDDDDCYFRMPMPRMLLVYRVYPSCVPSSDCSETCFFASDSDNFPSRLAVGARTDHTPRLQERRLSLGHKAPPSSATHDPLWAAPIQNDREVDVR